MGVTIYATKAGEPVFGFQQHDEHVVADDADARAERGEDILVANEHYVPGSGFDMAYGNFFALVDFLGLPAEVEEFDLKEVMRRCDETLARFDARLSEYGAAPRDREYLMRRVLQLRDVALVGSTRGADKVRAA